MHRLLDSVDRYVGCAGLMREVLAPIRPANVSIPAAPIRLDLRAEGIGTVVLATGYRTDNDLVGLPVKDQDGSFR